jgi:hypothetical protein
MTKAKDHNPAALSLPKCPTGIQGLDEVTGGGLPKGRPTLVCGAAGCGKTLLAIEFLVHGAVQYGEPGVMMAFEENAEELTQNVGSLGFDLDALVKQKKLIVDYVFVERSEIEETGEYDLEGLFMRLSHAIDSIGAKRVVLDTIEVLFSGLKDGHAVIPRRGRVSVPGLSVSLHDGRRQGPLYLGGGAGRRGRGGPAAHAPDASLPDAGPSGPRRDRRPGGPLVRRLVRPDRRGGFVNAGRPADPSRRSGAWVLHHEFKETEKRIS